MKKNDSRKNFLQQTGACVLVIGSLALTGDGDAATAAGTATATVLESVSVSISAPPTPVPAGVGTISALSGTLFTLESFMGSLSPSGPLLRFGSNPPPGFRVAAVPSTVDGTTVNVTCNADGSLSVSGGPGLTFAVSRSGVCVVNIEYN
jgi:hypothetical protein